MLFVTTDKFSVRVKKGLVSRELTAYFSVLTYF